MEMDVTAEHLSTHTIIMFHFTIFLEIKEALVLEKEHGHLWVVVLGQCNTIVIIKDLMFILLVIEFVLVCQ